MALIGSFARGGPGKITPGVTANIAIVGGGIVGLSTAIRTLDVFPDAKITIIAAHFTPNTTGDVAGGFFEPYLIETVSPEKLRAWCLDTMNFYNRLLKMGKLRGKSLGLERVKVYELGENPFERPPYADAFFAYRPLTPFELSQMAEKYTYGVYIESMTIECARFLPYLQEQLKSKGVKFVQKELSDLEEVISKYDVVMNCPGIGAAALVPDPKVIPVRGQTIRVHAPWVKNITVAGSFYVIPNVDNIVLGGTAQEGNYSLTASDEDRQAIWDGCLELVPSLEHAEVIGDFVGLRPSRNPIRVEREDRVSTTTGKTVPIIHNYGHGGSGITIAWGTTADSVELLRGVLLDKASTTMLKSNL